MSRLIAMSLLFAVGLPPAALPQLLNPIENARSSHREPNDCVLTLSSMPPHKDGVLDLSELSGGGKDLPGEVLVKLLVPAGVVGTGVAFTASHNLRAYWKWKWEEFTSPNHAFPGNWGRFKWRTWEEEKSESTQCDKLVHLYFSYIPVRPVSVACEYILRGLPSWLGGISEPEERVSGRSKLLAAAVVMGGGLMEEWAVDGHELDEGFSKIDMAANLVGVSLAVLREKADLENLRLYWSFAGTSPDYAWPWWTYMAGFEFGVEIDLSEFFFGTKRPNDSLFDWWVDTVGYLPSLNLLTFNNDQRYSESWER